jgi:hypothetical protein
VAALVARSMPPEEVFAAVTEDAGQRLSVGYATMARYAPDCESMVAAWSNTAAASGDAWHAGFYRP